MTLKELSQLYYLNREIERDKARLEELYTRATSATQTITGMPRASGVSDKLASCTAEIADLKGIIDANIQRCFYELNRLTRYINSIDDSLTRQIFSLRFINGLTWRQVACHIGGDLSEGYVRNACYKHLKEAE